MNAFSSTPAHSVMPLGEMALDDVRRGAYRSEQRYMHADLSTAKTKADIFEVIASAFELGDSAAKTNEGLTAALMALKPEKTDGSPGFVVVLENWPYSTKFNADDRQLVLDAFRQAADYFYDEEIAFRVFYSVREASIPALKVQNKS